MAKLLVSIDQYLHTAYEGTDCEYVDGEIVERGMPNLDHSETQARFIELLYELKKHFPLLAFPEMRHRISATRYRIPDIAVHLQRPTVQVPERPPFVAIEIISPDDRFSTIQTKLLEYEEWGVKHIWIVDPDQRTLSIFENSTLRRVDEFQLPEFDVTIPATAILPPPQPTSGMLEN